LSVVPVSVVTGGAGFLGSHLCDFLLARGHRVTLLCGGTVAERPYRVVRNGGTYTQFLRAPLAYLRHFRSYDLIVEVCNGMPFLAPLWSRRPVLCLVNHMHTELWSIRFRPPFSTVGRNIERVVMPRVHRENLFLTVSPSTAESLQQIGVGQDRIRQICNGVEAPDPPTPRSPEPMFLAFGRLADYKRLDLLLGVTGVTALIFVVGGPVALVVPVLAYLAWRLSRASGRVSPGTWLPWVAFGAMVVSGLLSAAHSFGSGLLGPFGGPAQACALVALAAALTPTVIVRGPAPEGRQPTTTVEENR